MFFISHVFKSLMGFLKYMLVMREFIAERSHPKDPPSDMLKRYRILESSFHDE